MTAIDISKLTPAQLKELSDKIKEQEKTQKAQKDADKKALEDLAVHAFPEAINMLRAASEMQAKAKAFVYRTFMDYLKLKIEQMEVNTAQKSHTITVNKESIVLGYNISDGYGSDAPYGVAMVHKFLETLGTDANSRKLVKSIYRLLQKNSNGDLDSKKITVLKNIADVDFPGTDLQKGVDIIQKDYKPKLSKWYIKASYIDGLGAERSIPLSITSADFPEDIDLSFLLPED